MRNYATLKTFFAWQPFCFFHVRVWRCWTCSWAKLSDATPLDLRQWNTLTLLPTSCSICLPNSRKSLKSKSETLIFLANQQITDLVVCRSQHLTDIELDRRPESQSDRSHILRSFSTDTLVQTHGLLFFHPSCRHRTNFLLHCRSRAKRDVFNSLRGNGSVNSISFFWQVTFLSGLHLSSSIKILGYSQHRNTRKLKPTAFVVKLSLGCSFSRGQFESKLEYIG